MASEKNPVAQSAKEITKEYPKEKVQELVREQISLKARLFTALFFVIIGFNFAHADFFEIFPLFGYEIITEILFSILAGTIGFFLIPDLVVATKFAIYRFMFSAVSEIVSNFWEQQTERMHQTRRQKQRERAKKIKADLSGGIVLDTSVLVDGRILDIARLGFMPNKIIIPNIVTAELHLISDSEDALKRQRGRRGLDVVTNLRKDKIVSIHSPSITGKTNFVDKTLVEFCKKQKLSLMTLDFNLNKLAETQGIRTLNINELVEAIKTKYLPGEKLTIKLVQEGKEDDQAVGYLDDGTMVVVESAKENVGNTVDVTVKKIIQGPAGKMLFCKLFAPTQ